jgi:hypothetical protein
MQIQGKLLLGLLLVVTPAKAQTPQPKFLPEYDQMCNEKLADGRPYERWYRLFVTEWKGQKVYVGVRAYYMRGSGEFFWHADNMSEQTYEVAVKRYSNQPKSCAEFLPHVVFLQDGHWDDFYGTIRVFHSDLKLDALEKGWAFVLEHWRETAFDAAPNPRWVTKISIGQPLEPGFFRPKSLEFDARPYFYNPLGSVKRVGANWEVEIKGADEPNRAIVLLDANFKLISVTKLPSQP